MTNENESSQTSVEIENLIRKAKKVGFTEVPESTSELETKLILVMKNSGKIHTAKQMFEILQEKNAKWFSDKMWNLAKKGVLTKLPTRGFYQFKQSQ